MPACHKVQDDQMQDSVAPLGDASTSFATDTPPNGKEEPSRPHNEVTANPQDTTPKLDSAESWNDWACLQYKAGNLADAERGYKRALDFSDTHRTTSVNLAFLLLGQGRRTEAEVVLAPHRAGLTASERETLAPLLHNFTQEQTVERLNRSVEYLLIAALNASAPRETGQASNNALTTSFLNLVQSIRPKLFFDIGANDGSIACRCKKLLPECEVWAFEANPQIHERFQAAVSACGVRYTNLAIAGSTGQMTIYVPRTLSTAIVDGEVVAAPSVEPLITGKSSLLKRNEAATYLEFTVHSARLDDILSIRRLEGNERDVALWIDVEGAAAEVLSGATNVLSRTSILFIESENHEFWSGQKKCADIARELVAAGFVPLGRDREYGDLQFNTLFVHTSCLPYVYPNMYQLSKSGPESNSIASSAPTLGNRQPQTKRHTSFAARSMADTPMFVPVFNNPTYARKMLAQLSQLGLNNVYLIDNGSTSDRMHQFLNEAEGLVNVVRTGQNNGPRDIVLGSMNYECLPDVFCVTDPDLEFNAELPENFLANLLWLTRRFKVGKAGMALRIDDVELMHRRKFKINGREYHATEWELQYWREPVETLEDGSPAFRAHIDTTFALYNKTFFSPNSFYQAIRVAGRYTCRHLPWYVDSGLSEAEANLYRSTQRHSMHLAHQGAVNNIEQNSLVPRH